MKRSWSSRWLVVILAAGWVGCVGDGGPRVDTAETAAAAVVDLAAEEAAVRGVIDRFYAAAEAKDWPAVAAVMSDEFRLFADGAEVYLKAPYMEVLEEGDLGVLEMNLKDLEIHVAAAGDSAWSTFQGYFKHSEELEVETAETLLFQKMDGEWKIVHGQAAVKVLGEEGELSAESSADALSVGP